MPSGPELPVPKGLGGVLDVVIDKLGCGADYLLLDFYAHQALRAIRLEFTSPALSTVDIDSEHKTEWAFAGGTSLLSALRVIDRVSEDLDLVVFAVPGGDLKPLRVVMRALARQAAAGVTGGSQALESLRGGSAVVSLDAQPRAGAAALRIDVSPCWPHAGAVIKRDSIPLLGRYAPVSQSRRDDLAPVRVPILHPTITAVNKLAALHGFAAADDVVGLAARVRDLYDLACLAKNEDIHTQISDRTPAIAAAPTFVQRQANHPRPAKGYGASPAFAPGTEAYRTLRDAYDGLHHMMFGDWRPSFAEAVKLTRSLDLVHDAAAND